jgi:hypothetical protein
VALSKLVADDFVFASGGSNHTGALISGPNDQGRRQQEVVVVVHEQHESASESREAKGLIAIGAVTIRAISRALVAVTLISSLMSGSSLSEENPARKLLNSSSSAQENSLYVDCFNITENLVDISGTANFEQIEKSLGRRIERSPGVRRNRVQKALLVAEQIQARSILQLGLTDEFAPLFMLTDRSPEECKNNGCILQVVQTLDWFTSSTEPGIQTKVLGELQIDGKSMLRLSNFWPISSTWSFIDSYNNDLEGVPDPEIDWPSKAFFLGHHSYSSLQSTILVIGYREEFALQPYLMKPRCSYRDDEWREGATYPECIDLRSLYQKYFNGEMRYDDEILLYGEMKEIQRLASFGPAPLKEGADVRKFCEPRHSANSR